MRPPRARLDGPAVGVLVAVAVVVVSVLARPVTAGAVAPSSVQHPSAALTRISLDYQAPLTLPDGRTAVLVPLEQGLIAAAEADFAYLRYLTTDDLGGFAPAPLGRFADTASGRTIGAGRSTAAIPFLSKVGDKVTVFGYQPGTPPPPPTVPPTTPTTTVPPTTIVPPTTTVPTTTVPPLFIAMTNNHGNHALIHATNMAPGDSASEIVVLANAGTVPFGLSMQAIGSQNALARALILVVSFAGGPVLYSGPLSASGVRIEHLVVGQSVQLRVTLHLPLDAGNDLQSKSVTLDLIWNGVG
ncbi:MAG: hypothetical protein ACYCSF_14050 [Acidimicrobiales bacterium]